MAWTRRSPAYNGTDSRQRQRFRPLDLLWLRGWSETLEDSATVRGLFSLPMCELHLAQIRRLRFSSTHFGPKSCQMLLLTSRTSCSQFYMTRFGISRAVNMHLVLLFTYSSLWIGECCTNIKQHCFQRFRQQSYLDLYHCIYA